MDGVIRAVARWFDRNPLTAVYIGILIAFVLMEVSAAIIKH